MGTSTARVRGDTYLPLLGLPIGGSLAAAAAVYFTSGPFGFDLLWVRWTPGVIGFLVFVALFALLTAFYLLRGLFRWKSRCAKSNDTIHDSNGANSNSSECNLEAVMKKQNKSDMATPSKPSDQF